MKNKRMYGLLALVVAGLVLAGGVSAIAGELRENASPSGEMKEVFKAALESGSYEVFVDAIEGTRKGEHLLEVINEDNFSEFASKTLAFMEANEEYKAYMDELGLKPPMGSKKGMKQGKGFPGEGKLNGRQGFLKEDFKGKCPFAEDIEAP